MMSISLKNFIKSNVKQNPTKAEHQLKLEKLQYDALGYIIDNKDQWIDKKTDQEIENYKNINDSNSINEIISIIKKSDCIPIQKYAAYKISFLIDNMIKSNPEILADEEMNDYLESLEALLDGLINNSDAKEIKITIQKNPQADVNPDELKYVLSEIKSSYSKKDFDKLDSFRDFIEAENIRNIDEETWLKESDYWHPYLKEVWRRYKMGELF